jgi:protein ImuB
MPRRDCDSNPDGAYDGIRRDDDSNPDGAYDGIRRDDDSNPDGAHQLSFLDRGQRLACVNVPGLPLQLLLRTHRDWNDHPAAVIDRDAPQGKLLWVNRHAWRARIRPGQSYAEGLSLNPNLHAGIVSDNDVAAGIDFVTECLGRFSPEIEPSSTLPGVFWMNAAGMTLLFPSLDDWARSIREELGRQGFQARIVVGFSRFATYALARSANSPTVLRSVEHENDLGHNVPLERLDLPAKLLETLAKLGVHTVGTFLRLPPGGLLRRFGQEAYELYRLASGNLWSPLTPRAIEEPLEQKIVLDRPIAGVARLIHVIESLLDPLLERLESHGQAIAILHLLFVLDSKENSIESVRPAEPTLDKRILLELVGLKLHATRLPAGVTEIEIRGEAVRVDREQLAFETVAARRDLGAADRALARIRAELGEEAVVRACLRNGHLPEAGFSWDPLGRLPQAKPREVALRPLIRRILARPTPLPPRPRNERNDNWLLHEPDYGPVVRMLGPYIVSGGWWMSTVHREYHFIETRRGDLLWAYYDRRRRRWFLHGRVD